MPILAEDDPTTATIPLKDRELAIDPELVFTAPIAPAKDTALLREPLKLPFAAAVPTNCEADPLVRVPASDATANEPPVSDSALPSEPELLATAAQVAFSATAFAIEPEREPTAPMVPEMLSEIPRVAPFVATDDVVPLNELPTPIADALVAADATDPDNALLTDSDALKVAFALAFPLMALATRSVPESLATAAEAPDSTAELTAPTRSQSNHLATMRSSDTSEPLGYIQPHHIAALPAASLLPTWRR